MGDSISSQSGESPHKPCSLLSVSAIAQPAQLLLQRSKQNRVPCPTCTCGRCSLEAYWHL